VRGLEGPQDLATILDTPTRGFFKGAVPEEKAIYAALFQPIWASYMKGSLGFLSPTINLLLWNWWNDGAGLGFPGKDRFWSPGSEIVNSADRNGWVFHPEYIIIDMQGSGGAPSLVRQIDTQQISAHQESGASLTIIALPPEIGVGAATYVFRQSFSRNGSPFSQSTGTSSSISHGVLFDVPLIPGTPIRLIFSRALSVYEVRMAGWWRFEPRITETHKLAET
jgi:hypothetical protein